MARPILQYRFIRFVRDVALHTPLFSMILLLAVLWLCFCGLLYYAEQASDSGGIHSYGEALYWGVAAFSTAGMAAIPVTDLGRLVGAIWIIIGSALFFGTIVATITTYFMRPMQRPVKKIIDTIEYNLEQIDDLDMKELNLLKKTTDTLILHMEKLRAKHDREGDEAREQHD